MGVRFELMCQATKWRTILLGAVACFVVILASNLVSGSKAKQPNVLMTLDPGHFHAGLIQQEMLPQVSPRVHVYAPLGPDLLGHVDRITRFNSRRLDPTRWELEIHASPDFLDRMIHEHPGNIVVISGRNRDKIDRIRASIDAGLHVLADKPWIIEASDLPKLEAALKAAERRGVVAYDIMTERFPITSVLQRELIVDPEVFGSPVAGSEAEPGVSMESIHHLFKLIAGAPLSRPAWFFDIGEQGEGLSDVGTHLVDLVQWNLFPEAAIDLREDIRIVGARRWPTALTREQFVRITGETDFPAYLGDHIRNGSLEYFCNTEVQYTIRGIRVGVKVLWNYEAAPGVKDSYLAVFRGTKARVEVRQGAEQQFRPEVYIVPRENHPGVLAAVNARIAALQSRYSGLSVEDLGEELRIDIPDAHRVGHEECFARVASRFFEFVKDRTALPSWERPNMLAKYYVTTKGVEIARGVAAAALVESPQ